MRICIATGIYPPSVGGPATYSKLLHDELPQRGVGVHIATYDDVRHLPKGISHVAFFLKLVRTARDCDIIFAQDPVSVGLPALLASRLLRKKFFIRVAGDYAWEQGVGRFGVKDSIDEFQEKVREGRYGRHVQFLWRLQSFVVSHADQVVTPSKYFKRLVSGWGTAAGNVVHIYNGIEAHALYDRTESRTALGIPQDAAVLISSGRLVPWKGYGKLIDAFAQLGQENLYLYILGDGPEDGNLRALIEEKGLGDRVIMPGKVDRDTMFRYLCAADIFVLNTSFESFSFQIVEAMHVGLPIVSTDIGNIPEIVEDGEEGFLLAPDDVARMTAVLGELLRDTSLRARMGAKAQAKALLFGKDALIENLLALFGGGNGKNV